MFSVDKITFLEPELYNTNLTVEAVLLSYMGVPILFHFRFYLVKTKNYYNITFTRFSNPITLVILFSNLFSISVIFGFCINNQLLLKFQGIGSL